jgi:hypothetical protein
MGSDQLIINLTASTACFVEGYPTIQYENGASAISVTVADGGTAGDAAPVSKVAVGPTYLASFLMQFQASSPECSTATGLEIGLPGAAANVPVALNTSVASSWQDCSTVTVSPFEQGNGLDNYAG